MQDIKYLVDYFMDSLNNVNAFKFILVGTKLDAERKVSSLDGMNLSKEWNMPFIEVSSKNGTNINKLLDLICMQHPKEQQQNIVKQESKESENANVGSVRPHKRRLTLTNNTVQFVLLLNI